jgi:hypothetical protein
MVFSPRFGKAAANFPHFTRFFDHRQEKYSETLQFFAALDFLWEFRVRSDRIGLMPDSPPLPFDESFHRARFRLVHIEKVAYWRGRVGRADLMDTYDLSAAQASSDFGRYLGLNPDSLRYDLRRRRYFWVPGAKPVLHEPDFARAAEELLEGESGLAPGEGRILRLGYPLRPVDREIERLVLRAILLGAKLKMVYGTLGEGGVEPREAAPTGLGHDGFRWHFRAWCYRNGEYRDFVLGRVKSVEKEEENDGAELPPDKAWTKRIVVRSKLNPALPEEKQAALQEDFALNRNGVLEWPVREALAHYARQHLLSLASPCGRGGKWLPWFVEVE